MHFADDSRTLSRCRAITILFGLVVMAGCQVSLPGVTPKTEQRDGPPVAVPAGLADLPDPEVVDEPHSRYGNPASYTVAGRTYHVMNSSRGYTIEGRASWYGRKFHGRRTSSGEPFDMFALTAAHRTLPIPAFARVTNLNNGRETVVRINDRGPFHSDRVIDLSYAAAVKLGFAGSGTAPVRVEVLEPKRDFYLQAGAFSSLTAADKLKHQVQRLTGHSAFVVKVPGDDLYRVRIGPVQDRQEAEVVQSSVSAAALPKPRILPL